MGQTLLWVCSPITRLWGGPREKAAVAHKSPGLSSQGDNACLDSPALALLSLPHSQFSDKHTCSLTARSPCGAVLCCCTEGLTSCQASLILLSAQWKWTSSIASRAQCPPVEGRICPHNSSTKKSSKGLEEKQPRCLLLPFIYHMKFSLVRKES